MRFATKLCVSLVAVSLLGLAATSVATTAEAKNGAATKTSPKNAAGADDAVLLNAPDMNKLHRLLFSAALEGLYTDGVQDDVVDEMLRADPELSVPPDFSMHFVYGCPICMPIYDAFRAYRARVGLSFVEKKRKVGEKPKNTYGDGLQEELRARLLSGDFNTRCTAVAELTRTWVERKFQSLRLTAVEREGWSRLLKVGRKQGMGVLRNQSTARKQKKGEDEAKKNTRMTACPFCDGSAGSLDPEINSVFFQSAGKKTSGE